MKNDYAPKFEDLPDVLPIFPLGGVLLLPCGNLPLNIFEPRYKAMIEDAMRGTRMIGMVQTIEPDQNAITGPTPPIYKTGCMGKITEFIETPDGRYQITLTGICRFVAKEELKIERGYRRVRPDWGMYEADLGENTCLDVNRPKMKNLLKQYFDQHGMDCDWEKFDNVSDGRLITCLSMICPFSASEKQSLLEAACCNTRAERFLTVLEMSLYGHDAPTSHH